MKSSDYYFSLCYDIEYGTNVIIISPIYYFKSRKSLNDDIDCEIIDILPEYLERNSSNEWCVADIISKDKIFCDIRSLGFSIDKEFDNYIESNILPDKVRVY